MSNKLNPIQNSKANILFFLSVFEYCTVKYLVILNIAFCYF